MDVKAVLEIITASPTAQQDENKTALSAYLNQLIVNDFAALVQLLYQIDISEQKLRATLNENPEANAGDVLTELLIQRQREKMVARESAAHAKDDIAEEDRW